MLSRGSIGSTRVVDVIDKTNGMEYIPQDRCDQIMISSKLYDMPRSHLIINTTLISIENVKHQEVINNLTHDLNVTYSSPLNLIPMTNVTSTHSYVRMTTIPIIIIFCLIILLLGFLKYRKQKGTIEKMWSYFHTKSYIE